MKRYNYRTVEFLYMRIQWHEIQIGRPRPAYFQFFEKTFESRFKFCPSFRNAGVVRERKIDACPIRETQSETVPIKTIESVDKVCQELFYRLSGLIHNSLCRCASPHIAAHPRVFQRDLHEMLSAIDFEAYLRHRAFTISGFQKHRAA